MNDLAMITDNVLINFPVCLRNQFRELCLKSKIGLSSISLSDISIMDSKTANQLGLENFHFMVHVPYAGMKLKWEVLFDPEDFAFGVDFVFDDVDFPANPTIDFVTANVPSWGKWQLENPKALATILNDFLILYQKEQVEKLKSETIYSRYWEEYQELMIKEDGIGPERVQVKVGKSIDFLVSLDVDCSKLPPYAQPVNLSHEDSYNPGDDFAHLKLSYLDLEGIDTNVALQLSPRLGQILAPFRGINLPTFQNTTLCEYVTSVSEMLNTRIASVVEHYERKKSYIVSLVAACSHSIVEYDSEHFSKAVFLHTVDDYDCLITVSIGTKFPEERPTVQLSSIYCQENKSCDRIVDNYPYRYYKKTNIEHLMEYLDEEVKTFRCHKHK